MKLRIHHVPWKMFNFSIHFVYFQFIFPTFSFDWHKTKEKIILFTNILFTQLFSVSFHSNICLFQNNGKMFVVYTLKCQWLWPTIKCVSLLVCAFPPIPDAFQLNQASEHFGFAWNAYRNTDTHRHRHRHKSKININCVWKCKTF